MFGQTATGTTMRTTTVCNDSTQDNSGDSDVCNSSNQDNGDHGNSNWGNT